MSGPDWWRVGNACMVVLVAACVLLVVLAVLDAMVGVACRLELLDGGC